MSLQQQIIQLYKKAATRITPEAERLLIAAHKKEKNSKAKEVLGLILENLKIARKENRAICQDTGTPIFYVEYNPKKESEEKLAKVITQATKVATKKLPLRPNAVNSENSKNIGNLPLIYFTPAKKLKVTLMLKGGGSENIFGLYKLPDVKLKAERDEAGVQKCVLDAVKQAGAKGCPPYFLSIVIGGNVGQISAEAEKLHLATKKMNAQEKRWLKEINKLKIGALGFGGEATALTLKVKYLNRHPASFFVAVNFCCWAKRVASWE